MQKKSFLFHGLILEKDKVFTEKKTILENLSKRALASAQDDWMFFCILIAFEIFTSDPHFNETGLWSRDFYLLLVFMLVNDGEIQGESYAQCTKSFCDTIFRIFGELFLFC